MPDEKQWYSAKEACRYLEISSSSFFKLVRSGLITRTRVVGAHPRYHKSRLDAIPTGKSQGNPEEVENARNQT